MKTNTIILVAAAGAVAWYLYSRRGMRLFGPSAELTMSEGPLQTRVSGAVLKAQAIRSRTLPTYGANYDPDTNTNSGTGRSAADRMTG